MKEQAAMKAVEGKKIIAIGLLFAVSAAITLLGLLFCVYSAINRIDFQVMQANIPGAVFGLVITFLGVRYFLAVRKLKVEVYKSISRFSLGNFKKKQRTHAL